MAATRPAGAQRNVETIIREELDQRRSGTTDAGCATRRVVGRKRPLAEDVDEMLRMQDRHERDFFGPTHEEVITDIFRREVQSYKQLPVNFIKFKPSSGMNDDHALGLCAPASSS